MSTLVQANTVAPASERRTFTIAAVAALHVAVIYTIMVALNIVPSPLPDHETRFRVIPPNIVVDHPPVQVIHSGGTFVKPDAPTAVKPDIDIDHGTGGGGIPYTPGNTQADNFVTASAIAATHTIPSYPALDRRLGHEGTVLLAIWIGVDGNVSQATVARSSGFPGLDQAAIDWVKAHWRYKPATKNGAAVPSSTQASVAFRLVQG
ncbi:MAG TPA: energy transducer TonB [Rhizomicrobium sp.]|nr:energy transducer TonB [Rhizomicrobium sp.]